MRFLRELSEPKECEGMTMQGRRFMFWREHNNLDQDISGVFMQSDVELVFDMVLSAQS